MSGKNESSRDLPHSLEAEEGLLSCCFIDGNDVVPRCLEAGISRDSFYDPKYGIIYNRIVQVHGRGIPVQVPTVAEELRDSGELEQIGGYPIFTQVTDKGTTLLAQD